MDALTLFPDIELEARSPGPDACRAPIGRGLGHRRRARSVRPRRPSAAAMLLELRQLLERQHAELMFEIGQLRQQRRNEHESLPAILRRISQIERHLRLVEIPVTPRVSRRNPLGV